MSELTNLFRSLAEIPSPSLDEAKVATVIMDFFHKNHINCRQDSFGNVYAVVPATDSSKKPLMLSAHMDVVGDSSAVNIVERDGFIETDKTRTLGADDKAGVACAMLLAKTVADNKTMKHGGLEIVFTRDEEQNMTGARAVEYNTLNAEHILVLDADRMGDFQIAGAGYTKLIISVTGTKGGHSGIDIADTTRVNALKILADIAADMPQGVYASDETGVITSINLGAIVGGGVKNIHSDKQGTAFMRELTDRAMSNIINTDAFALYSIRSSDRQIEAQLRQDIEKVIDKHHGSATVSAHFDQHLPPFEKARDTEMADIAEKAANHLGVKLNISSFHAGAETHLYAQQTNKNGQSFKPILMGIANIYDMHSANERVEAKSMDQGFELLKEIFKQFNA